MIPLPVIVYFVSILCLGLGFYFDQRKAPEMTKDHFEHDIRIACIQSGREIVNGKCLYIYEDADAH